MNQAFMIVLKCLTKSKKKITMENLKKNNKMEYHKEVKMEIQKYITKYGMSQLKIAEIIGVSKGMFYNKWNDKMIYHKFKKEELEKLDNYFKN